MQKLLLLAGLALATCPAARAQYTYSDYMPTLPPARPATPDPADKPQYAGLYLNGKQLTEIDCYGFDSFDLVLPNFANFASADQVAFLIGVYQYDQNGKPAVPRADYIERFDFEGPKLEALVEKFRGKGYIVLSRSGQLNEYNQHRELIPGNGNQLIFAPSSSLNCAKYSRTDPAKAPQTVLIVQAITGKVTSYYTNPDGSSVPRHTYTTIYRAPAVLLRNRVYTKTLTLKSKGIFGKELPEMQAENCTTNKGADIPLSTVKKVAEDGYGEEIQLD